MPDVVPSKTFQSDVDSTVVPEGATQTPNSTGKEKKNLSNEDRRQMAKDIFQVSTNRGIVTTSQVERIKRTNDRISSGAAWTWDYGSFLFIASMIAALGLASDSSTTIIASMLVSPLMGPVIGMTYGLFVHDFPLMRVSIRREIVSIALCVLYGFVLGLPMSWLGNLAKSWPTEQMATRGSLQNFVIGIPVAFFSGLGVALSFAEDNVSSLVGVAISASLLPPAVNSGICWAHAIHIRKTTGGAEFVEIGGISLALCVMNVVCVFLSGMLMFRIKEVLPIEKGVFWHDLKLARRINTKRADIVDDAGETGEVAPMEGLDSA